MVMVVVMVAKEEVGVLDFVFVVELAVVMMLAKVVVALGLVMTELMMIVDKVIAVVMGRALRVDPDPTRGSGFDPQPDPAGLDTNPTRISDFSPFFFVSRHTQLQVL